MIHVFDRDYVQEEWFPQEPTIAIRCLSSKYIRELSKNRSGLMPEIRYDFLRGDYVYILPLVFDDIRNPKEGDKRYVLFREVHAEKIKRFVEKNLGKFKDVMVHCDAGMSRSCAVAVALGEHYGWEYDKEILTRHQFGPNALVYKTLIDFLKK